MQAPVIRWCIHVLTLVQAMTGHPGLVQAGKRFPEYRCGTPGYVRKPEWLCNTPPDEVVPTVPGRAQDHVGGTPPQYIKGCSEVLCRQGRTVGADENRRMTPLQCGFQGMLHALSEISLDLPLQLDAVACTAGPEKRFLDCRGAPQIDRAQSGPGDRFQTAVNEPGMELGSSLFTQERDQAGLDPAWFGCPCEHQDTTVGVFHARVSR
jgi:hypothetical protein